VAPKPPPSKRNASGLPNIVFLVVESTDGRTWSNNYSNSAIPLPNIRQLQAGGVQFRKHYANSPVCCPSRATFWSGRHASNLPHDHGGITVGGAWNNYEGLPVNYSDRIDQVNAM
jgi:arylsulfatase K